MSNALQSKTMDRYPGRPGYFPPRTQAAERTKLKGTTGHNPPALDKLLPSSSLRRDGADLGEDAEDAVPVRASIFAPFNSLTPSNLEILRTQQISKGIHKELAKIRTLRMFLRSLQISNPDFAPESKYGVGAAAYRSNNTQACNPTHLILETATHSVTRDPTMGLITPQSLEEQAEQDPFVSTPALQNPITSHVIPEPSKPPPTISGPTDSATAPVPAATGEEKTAILSWLGSISEDDAANTHSNTPESPTPKPACSEVHSDVNTTASVAYSRCRKRLNLQIENLRDWIKKGRAVRKAERALQRQQRSIKNSSQVNHQGFLPGAPPVNTAVNEAGDDARITKLLTELQEKYVERISAVEAKCVARIFAVEEACEFKVGELNAAFGARLADLEDERERVTNKLANAEKNISALATEIEGLTDSESTPGARQNQLKPGCKEDATSTYQRHGVGPGQGEAFRI
ncbi:hypothetical protein EV426DRAFT_640084 [Tirmania nivea]|nr:hypothetical protein EV426DRAFT_640084 [Tirmania nivea]